MPDEEVSLLKEISRKLDQLVILARISNRPSLRELRREIKRDKIALAIVETANGSLRYSELAKAVSKKTGVTDRTVKGRIAELAERGILAGRREGREVFYETSDLLTW